MVPRPENLTHQARIFRTSPHARNTDMHNRGRIVACNRCRTLVGHMVDRRRTAPMLSRHDAVAVDQCLMAARRSHTGRDADPFLMRMGRWMQGWDRPPVRSSILLSQCIWIERDRLDRQEGFPIPSLRGLAGAKISHLLRCVEGCGKAADERLYLLIAVTFIRPRNAPVAACLPFCAPFECNIDH
jgi:hypothetical protein